MVYFKHWLPCQYGFTSYLEKSDLEKKLQQWVIALNKLPTLLAHLTLWIQSTKRECKLNPGTKIFQMLSCFQCTGDIFFPLSLASVFISERLQEHGYVVVIDMVSLLGVLLLWYIPWPQTAWIGKDLFADTSTSPISTEDREGTKRQGSDATIPGVVLLTSLFLTDCLACFLKCPGLPTQVWYCPYGARPSYINYESREFCPGLPIGQSGKEFDVFSFPMTTLVKMT